MNCYCLTFLAISRPSQLDTHFPNLGANKWPYRTSILKPDPSRKMRNEIMCRELPEFPPDLSPKAKSLQKCCLKMSPKLSPKSCVSSYRWAAAEEFPATSSPQPITPRDEIPRSGNPSLRSTGISQSQMRTVQAQISASHAPISVFTTHRNHYTCDPS